MKRIYKLKFKTRTDFILHTRSKTWSNGAILDT